MIPEKKLTKDQKDSPERKLSIAALFLAVLYVLLILATVFAILMGNNILNGPKMIAPGMMNDILRPDYPDYPALAEWSFSTTDDSQLTDLATDTSSIPTEIPIVSVKCHKILPTNFSSNISEESGIRNIRKRFRREVSTRTNRNLTTKQVNAPDSKKPVVSSTEIVPNTKTVAISKQIVKNRNKSSTTIPTIMNSLSKLRLAQTTKSPVRYPVAPELNTMHFVHGVTPRKRKNLRTYVSDPDAIGRAQLDVLIREAQAEENERQRKLAEENFQNWLEKKRLVEEKILLRMTQKRQYRLNKNIPKHNSKKSRATHTKRRKHMQKIVRRRNVKKRQMNNKSVMQRKASEQKGRSENIGRRDNRKDDRFKSDKKYSRPVNKKVPVHKTTSRKHPRRKQHEDVEKKPTF